MKMSEMINEYSKALFELASEGNNVRDYEKALDLLTDVFNKNPQYAQLLSSPGIPLAERLGTIEKAFSSNLPVEVMSFIKLLCEKGYIKYFDQCVVEYKKLLNEANKCINAKVTSAITLSDQEKTALINNLEKTSGRTVLPEWIVDASILGGLIIELDGKTVDASIKRHLKNVKDVIGK
jgi:F-type H+-transporting ATPase subunit delta